jgi:hypothetical protein
MADIVSGRDGIATLAERKNRQKENRKYSQSQCLLTGY